MAERRQLSKKLRFEVFKRDSFTCQYCGRKAPDIILEIDHITPISKGGKNNIMNLITSCFDCNRGKGNRKLGVSDTLEKQRIQAEILNLKRKQLVMLNDWYSELLELENKQIETIENFFKKSTGCELSISLHTRNQLKLEINKYGFNEIIECLNIALKQYAYVFNDTNKIINYTFRIANVRSRNRREQQSEY